MPQALELDHNEVRIVAVQIGVREAARQFGLNEETVMSWSKREGWLKEREEQEELVKEAQWRKREAQGLPAVERKAVDVLREYDGDTRLGLAKGINRGARKIAEMDGDEVLISSQQIASLAKSAALVHGWNDPSQSVTVNLAVLGDHLTDCPSIDV